MVRMAEQAGFVTPEQLGMVTWRESPDALLDEIAALAARGTSPGDLRRI